VNTEPLTLATTEQRSQYRRWAEAIATKAKSNRISDLFRSYAQIASDDGSHYGATPDFGRNL